MPEIMSWFELNQNIDDLNNVLNFIESVPGNLKNLFDEASFRELLDNDYNDYQISSQLFFNALNEAELQLIEELNEFRRKMSEDENFIFDANTILTQIGFTRDSLTLKVNVLNKLWDGVVKAENGIISFARNTIVKPIRKFLKYLNSLLGSLTSLIPALDAIKEIKETGESYLEYVE